MYIILSYNAIYINQINNKNLFRKMSKITVNQMNEETFNLILNHSLMFDQSTERKKKRIFQMQQRKAYLNEAEVPKIDNIVHTSSRCTTELTPSNLDNKVAHQEALTLIQSKSIMDPDAEVNVSDLDCSVESTEEKSKEKIKCDRLIKEYKPFIQLNNNLKYKVSVENKSNTLSYLLALNQGEDSDVKSKNFQVEEVINEEKENENESPSKPKHKFITMNKAKSDIPKSEEFGRIKKSINQSVKVKTNKSSSMSKLNVYNNKSLMTKKHSENSANNKKEQKKKLNISTSFYIKKPKVKQSDAEGYRNTKQNHVRNQTSLMPNDSFAKIIIKNITLKYQQKPLKKRRLLNNSNNKIQNQTNKSVIINKKVTHRKNATVVIPDKLHSRYINNSSISSSSVMIHKKISSIAMSSNKQSVLALMLQLKYVSHDHYLQATQSIKQSKRNVYIMVKKLKESPSLIFRAVYESNSTNEYLNQIYSCAFCPYKISFDEMIVGYSFNSQKDIFTKEIRFKKDIRSGATVQCFSM